MDKEEDTRDYQVLVNSEEQYSLWLAGQAVPNGWRQVGPTGQKQICLDYVKEVWTDMRPLSVRKAMEKYQAEQAAKKAAGGGGGESAEGVEKAESVETAEGAAGAPPAMTSGGEEAGAPA
jgi:MbtH protein